MDTATSSHAPAPQAPISEGYMDFLGYRSYYRIVGDLSAPNPPLILLHGGPGSTHNYMEILDPLALATNRAIISYDQLGCGKSFVEHRPDLWKLSTWMDELACLCEHLKLSSFYLLGQSWGGMLALNYALEGSKAGLKGLILSSTLPSSKLWALENHRQAAMLPAHEWSALCKAEQTNSYDSPAYQQAIDHFMLMHCCDLSYDETAPECLRRKKISGEESYLTAWGPNELVASGTLASWDVIARLPEISVPALIISGTDDECTPYIAKTMYDGIPHASWELFRGCRHMCFVEDTKHYLDVVSAYLLKTDRSSEV